MKKPFRGPFAVSLAVLLVFLLVFLLVSAAGCEAEKDLQDGVGYAVLIRLDRQRDIYGQLGDLLENYLVAENRDDVELQFRSFCLGVNCFVRDDSIYPYCNDLYQGNPDLSDTLIALMSTTARDELDRLPLSAFSDDALETLKGLCYELETCCQRGEEGTFAYFLSIQDLKSDSCQAALRDTRQLLQRVDEIIASAGTGVT